MRCLQQQYYSWAACSYCITQACRNINKIKRKKIELYMHIPSTYVISSAFQGFAEKRKAVIKMPDLLDCQLSVTLNEIM